MIMEISMKLISKFVKSTLLTQNLSLSPALLQRPTVDRVKFHSGKHTCASEGSWQGLLWQPWQRGGMSGGGEISNTLAAALLVTVPVEVINHGDFTALVQHQWLRLWCWGKQRRSFTVSESHLIPPNHHQLITTPIAMAQWEYVQGPTQTNLQNPSSRGSIPPKLRVAPMAAFNESDCCEIAVREIAGDAGYATVLRSKRKGSF
ncbi:hypothetical protein Pelo_884 [Pelomyxa schiedti]|nr:hypothetical protein Pelo_884 [Pelomyxa schiedti]